MNTDTKSVADLEELLEAEIPCHACGKEALLRSSAHNCPVDTAPYYKCLDCYLTWLNRVSRKIAKSGFVRCNPGCRKRFYSVQSFSDYRPF